MDLQDALSKIEEIKKHILRSEVFRGYTPLPCFVSGCAAFLLGLSQLFLFPASPRFVWDWLLLAVVLAGGVFLWIGLPLLHREDKHQVELFKRIIFQFFPFLFVGGILTILFVRTGSTNLLPVIWAAVFGLGIFSMLPFLPARCWIIGCYYLVFCFFFILFSLHEFVSFPVNMMVSFGGGHLLASSVLYGAYGTEEMKE